MTTPDHELLEKFRTAGHEPSFTELVNRHFSLVYSSALRISRRSSLAEEASQAVFVKLARLRSPLPVELSLVTWLHRTTRSAAIDLVRAEVRRRRREETAASDIMTETPVPWDRIAPVLDEVIDGLSSEDRHLVLCRYFEGQSLGELGLSLGLSEDAVRMRVSRALDKLRSMLQNRGITATASALAISLPAYATSPVPAGLAGSVAAKAIASIIPSAPLITLGVITMTKKTAIVAAVLLLAAAGAAVYVSAKGGSTSSLAGSPARQPLGDSSGAGTAGREPPTSRLRPRQGPAPVSAEEAKLNSMYGEGRVKLARQLASSHLASLGKQGLAGVTSRIEAISKPRIIAIFATQLSLTAGQKERLVAMYDGILNERLAAVETREDYMNSHMELVTEILLAGDAFKRNQISEEEYKELSAQLPPGMADPVSTGLVGGVPAFMKDEKLLSGLKSILEPAQLARLRDPADISTPGQRGGFERLAPGIILVPATLEELDEKIRAFASGVNGIRAGLESIETLEGD